MSETRSDPAGAAEPAPDIVPSLDFSPNLARWLLAQRISLAFTSYQTGRLLLMGVGPDGRIAFSKQNYTRAMGLHYAEGRLHLASAAQIWRLENILDPGQYANRAYDGVFVPRVGHTTGYVDAHDLAVDGEGRVIFVNTRFSCLATIDPVHSFRELWRPSFISELAPEDRCHLNGVAVIEGEPAYVTALGESNEPAGWRARKADGGIVIDLRSNEIVARGLCMPHSPRWYDGKLWVLESGQGRLCTIDPLSGAKEIVAEVPGFARGLAFAGPFAFIGLSQVRESVFDGIPVAKRSERHCGVWAVDLRDGKTAGFVRFEGSVQEIFDVQLVPGYRYPDVLEPADEFTGAAFVLPETTVQSPA